MSAPKAGTYVLTGAAFYRVEGEGDDAVRRRYKRGDRVELSKAEAVRLAVPQWIGGRTVPAEFVLAAKAGDVPTGDDLAAGVPLNPQDAVQQLTGIDLDALNQIVAEVTGGEGGGDGSQPDPDGNGGGQEPAEDDRQPAQSANLPVWQAYAVKVGAVTEEQAAEMTKAQLKQAVADKAAE